MTCTTSSAMSYSDVTVNAKCCLCVNADLSGSTLVKGQRLHVIGFANRRGFLTVDLGSSTMQVPHQLTEVWVRAPR